MSDEEKEEIVLSIIKHFENPEPLTPPKQGGKGKFGGKYNSSFKDNRKSSSDKENDCGSPTPKHIDQANGHKNEEDQPQNEITQSHENGDN